MKTKNRKIIKPVIVVAYNSAAQQLVYFRNGKIVGGLRGSVAEATFFRCLESGVTITFF